MQYAEESCRSEGCTTTGAEARSAACSYAGSLTQREGIRDITTRAVRSSFVSAVQSAVVKPPVFLYVTCIRDWEAQAVSYIYWTTS